MKARPLDGLSKAIRGRKQIMHRNNSVLLFDPSWSALPGTKPPECRVFPHVIPKLLTRCTPCPPDPFPGDNLKCAVHIQSCCLRGRSKTFSNDLEHANAT